jgi:DNA-binding response OmpR family regulator
MRAHTTTDTTVAGASITPVVSAWPDAPDAQQPGAVADDRETPPQFRFGVLDEDSALLLVLVNRAEKLGWELRKLPAKISARALAEEQVDALSVDLAIVGADRWSWLRNLCLLRPDLAVVICSGQSSVTQRVLALRLGADDWLTKPCHPDELIARVERAAFHRRTRKHRRLEPIKVHALEIRPAQYQAFLAGRSLALTLREYHLLELLALGGGEVQQRERVYEALWGGEMARSGRSVDVCVHKLRRKLQLAAPGWQYIHTHYGVGYRLAAEPVDAPPSDLRIGGEPSAEEGRAQDAEASRDADPTQARLAA